MREGPPCRGQGTLGSVGRCEGGVGRASEGRCGPQGRPLRLDVVLNRIRGGPGCEWQCLRIGVGRVSQSRARACVACGLAVCFAIEVFNEKSEVLSVARCSPTADRSSRCDTRNNTIININKIGTWPVGQASVKDRSDTRDSPETAQPVRRLGDPPSWRAATTLSRVRRLAMARPPSPHQRRACKLARLMRRTAAGSPHH